MTGDHWDRVSESTDEAGYAFLRWIERADSRERSARHSDLADGIVREWGQLAILASTDDAGRRYELRHVDDRDADPEALTDHDDPRDARWIAKFDAEDRYRPLKTAPTLRQGWRISDLAGPELIRAVDFFYPATVHNWHREREGDLDVSHWVETADRQTGIYEVVSDLPSEAVEWAAEACCVDSQCLKRREWDYDEATSLDADRGEGEFPCREPCSLFVAAAREWTAIEAEETQTYEIDLTPSERERIEGLIDAVADGSVGEVRDAEVDDPGNQYGARYLRAKRFQGDGGFREVED